VHSTVILPRMDAVFIFVMFVIVAVLLGRLASRRKEQHGLLVAQLAGGFGLQFAADDPFGLVNLRFRLFRMGDGRGCENVMWGDWRGMPVRAADYWYYKESSDANGNRSRSYERFSVVIAEVACFVPSVAVGRETVLTRLADHVGVKDIEFESEAFNRAFQVQAKDRAFAFKLMDPRMMQWLLDATDGFGFEMFGPNLLAYGWRREPEDLPPLFEIALAFRDHIPRLIWSEYGTVPREGSVANDRNGIS
jgi:hypothetical protein